MEKMLPSNSLVQILTSTHSIPYEVLKFYSYADSNVRLLHSLWIKTRTFLFKMKDTAFFESMMKTVVYNINLFKFIIDEITHEAKLHNMEFTEYLDFIINKSESSKNLLIDFYRSSSKWTKIIVHFSSEKINDYLGGMFINIGTYKNNAIYQIIRRMKRIITIKSNVSTLNDDKLFYDFLSEIVISHPTVEFNLWLDSSSLIVPNSISSYFKNVWTGSYKIK